MGDRALLFDNIMAGVIDCDKSLAYYCKKINYGRKSFISSTEFKLWMFQNVLFLVNVAS